MKKLIEKNIAEIIIVTLAIVFSSCSSTCDHESQKVVNIVEIENIAYDMIECIYEDVENDRIPKWTAEIYIGNLEQIIKEVK